MIDLISLGEKALVTLVLTKTMDKTGQILGKKAPQLKDKLMGLLRRNSPETASAIEKVAEQPELAEQQPEKYGQAVLVAKVEEAARGDSEIAEAIRALAETTREAMQAQPNVVQNLAQLAEKIGYLQQGGTTYNQADTISF
ncbi:MAG: hypothetical protein F6J93_38395 [Oscillatoria sp. SIO1A7]|nr:hypothetical protein [Oscillatoria sp. SIO1A7]